MKTTQFNNPVMSFNMTKEDWDIIKKVMLGMDAADSHLLMTSEIVLKHGIFGDDHIDAIFCTEVETPLQPWAYWSDGVCYVDEVVMEDWWIQPYEDEVWEAYDPTYEIEKGFFTKEEWDRFLWMSRRFNDMINYGENTL